MDYGYADLEPSFHMEDTFVGVGGNIHDLCNTYLSNMGDTYSLPKCETSVNLSEHLHNFQILPVADWRGEDVEEWATEVLKQQQQSCVDLDLVTYDLWRLRSVSGSQLLRLSYQDLKDLVGDVGSAILYQQLQILKASCSNRSSQEGSISNLDNNSKLLYDEASGSSNLSMYCASDSLYDSEDSWKLSTTTYDQQLYRSIDTVWSPASEDTGIQDYDTFSHDTSYDSNVLDEFQSLYIQEASETITSAETVAIPCTDHSSANYSSSSVVSPGEDTNGEAGLDFASFDVLKKIRCKSRKRERGPKSWEFLIRLLMDKRFNPSLIRWEDKESGTFRLMQPAIITKMWATRTSEKKNISYNNFARGLRHHYTTGALQPVMEKQLVYRCGPSALQYLAELQQESQTSSSSVKEEISLAYSSPTR